ncbi:MAG: hypothetical protein BWZ01_01759 [Deltaproteobacteria bacterium ADurb.BinA179]|nr:MAG: hypothetical protein BWZ01_01759 [Deltaproteobacteria bacterium ADurb.BinA179]
MQQTGAYESARRVRGAVGAVGAGGKEMNALHIVLSLLKIIQERERHFLIPPAFSVAFDGHRGLSSGNHQGGFREIGGAPADVPGNGCEEPGRFPGFTREHRGEEKGAVPEIRAVVTGCSARREVVAEKYVEHPVEHVISLLRRVGVLPRFAGFEHAHHRGREHTADAVFVNDANGLGIGGVVGHRDPGCDAVEAVSYDVGEDDVDHPGGEGGMGEASALHPGYVLADAVDFPDVRPGLQEDPCGFLLVAEGDAFRREAEQ